MTTTVLTATHSYTHDEPNTHSYAQLCMINKILTATTIHTVTYDYHNIHNYS